MIARPARVRIRERKPCFRFRRRVFGWYVRFMLVLEFHHPRRATRHEPLRSTSIQWRRSSGGALVAHTANGRRAQERWVPPGKLWVGGSRCNDDHVVGVPVKCRNGPNPPQPRTLGRPGRPPHRPPRTTRKRVAGALTANLYSGPAFGRHARPEPCSSLFGGTAGQYQRGGVRGLARPSGATASLVQIPREHDSQGAHAGGRPSTMARVHSCG